MTNENKNSNFLEASLENAHYRKLWIGNMDPKMTEFALLKLLQKHGAIEKFDILYHRSGPLEGHPRGYAFVTYTTTDSANSALKNLHGKRFGNKTLCVRHAYSISKDTSLKQGNLLKIPALVGAQTKSKIKKSLAIQAIEAKLKKMEEMEETSLTLDFEINCKPEISTTDSTNFSKSHNSRL